MMRIHSLRRALGTAAALVLAGTAAVVAQEQSELSARRIPGWSFTPGVTVASIFDSNVALADAPADTRRTQGDQLFIMEPFGQLEFVAPRTEFAAGYRGFIRRYQDVDQLNGFDQRGHLSLKRLATKRLTITLRDTYAHVPTTDEVELNGVPFVRTGARTNSFAGGVDVRLTKFTNLSVRYDQMWVDFDRQDTLLTGGWVNGVRTELSRQLDQRSSFGAEYGIRRADLDNRARQITFHDVGATYRYSLAEHTLLSLAGGMSRLQDHTIDDTRSGPYVRAGLTRATEHATFGVSYERTYVPSFGFGGSNQSQEFRTFVRMPFERNRLYVQGSAAWRRSDPFVEEELLLDTISLRSTVGYGLTRWLRLEGFYAFTRQDSQVTGGEINRHRGGLQVVVSQPMRIR